MAGRILIVDDDPAIRQLLVEFLADEGFEMFSAVDGLDAINQARHKQPDCIFMDLNMPVLNGEKAIETLKSDDATSAIRIYAMSARSVIRSRNGDLMADGTLEKPFDLISVLEMANHH